MAKSYPDWFLAIYERGFVFWMAIGLLFVLPLLSVALYLDDQIDDTEARLQTDLNEIDAQVSNSEDAYLRELGLIRQDLRELKEEVRALGGSAEDREVD